MSRADRRIWRNIARRIRGGRPGGLCWYRSTAVRIARRGLNITRRRRRQKSTVTSVDTLRDLKPSNRKHHTR